MARTLHTFTITLGYMYMYISNGNKMTGMPAQPSMLYYYYY